MSREFTRKNLKQDELVDVAVGAKQWFDRNWATVARWGGAVAVVALIVLVWVWNVNRNREQAAELATEGLAVFQEAQRAGFSDPAQLELALARFEDAVDHAGGSATGRMAGYYKGVTLMRLERLDEAVGALEEVATASGEADTLRGSAQALLVNAYVEQGRTPEAITFLQELATEGKSAAYPIDQLLVRLGRLHQTTGNDAEARRVWQQVSDDYPASAGAREAQALLEPVAGS